MSSRSYFYNKHPNRSKSYYGKKRIYGSAYQPGQTTKYQRYGRTMRLDPSYINIPRSLPTRQSQLRQLEELRKAGLIPDPVPPSPPTPVPVVYNYLADVFLTANASDLNKNLGAIIKTMCDNKGYNINNLIGVSFSGKIHHTPSQAQGYTNIIQIPSFMKTGYYIPVYFKTTSSTAIDILYNVVLINPEIVYQSENYIIRSKKARIIIQVSFGSGSLSLMYNSSNNQLPVISASSQGASLSSTDWNALTTKGFYWVDTPDLEGENEYYYMFSSYNLFGRVSTSGGYIPPANSEWDNLSSGSLWTRLSESDQNFANSSVNNGVVLEFAIPQE